MGTSNGFVLSKKSKGILSEVHDDMQEVVMLAIHKTKIDFGVTEGARDPVRQAKLYAEKKTKTLKSKHLPCFPFFGVRGQQIPGLYKSGAVDLVGYFEGKISWDDSIYHEINEAMQTAAKELNITIRWGGDWDMDGDTTDQTFNDLCHWELYGEKYKPTWDHIYNEEA